MPTRLLEGGDEFVEAIAGSLTFLFNPTAIAIGHSHPMQSALTQAYCLTLQQIVRSLVRLTGRGSGKFLPLLPKGQTFLMDDYCHTLKFHINTTYPIEGMIWLSGMYDAETTQLLQTIIRKTDAVIDVGANCGALTLVAATLAEEGVVYAFEPGQPIRDRLTANLALNPTLHSRVQVIPLGLGAEPQQLHYYEDPTYRGNGALFAEQGLPVQVVTLDDWANQTAIAQLNCLKIDVEGMEYAVMLGGKETLLRFHPILYFETLPIFFTNKPYTIRTIYEFLAGLGYQLRHPTPPYAEIPVAGPYPANSLAICPQDLWRLETNGKKQ
jgi:FkbM family methyltransferase